MDCHPDIVTLAKPLANGYPIGAVLMRDAVMGTMTTGMDVSITRRFDDKFETGSHGTTFGGSPLACSLGFHVLDRLSQREFISHLNKTSAFLLRRLERLSGWFPELVGPIRGCGLIIGLVLIREGDAQRLVELARERGVLLLTAGTDCVRLVPSLNVSEGEVSHAVDVIESCLSLLS